MSALSDEYYDEELEAVRMRRLQEYQRRLIEEQRRKELEARREALLRQILEPKAKERLYNLKLVRPEIARVVEDQLIELAQTGRVRVPISETVVKELLTRIYDQLHRETKIKIKEK
ncbi:MAG: DNA-binding protein [Desulfurococcaceae archaeon]|nr:DNA-binding protein [Sulfolobales archaeon]MDW8170833.1 DNA-binding protein [Desulfurococcaceae archaeon]